MESGFYIREIDGEFYPFRWDSSHGNVASFGPLNPKEGGTWIARACDDGIKYVSRPFKSYSGAYKFIRRHTYNKSSYKGIW